MTPVLGKPAYRLLKKIVDRRPNSPSLAKVEGLYRFYIEGLTPPEKQDWPECLELCKQQVLESYIGQRQITYETGRIPT
jgi:hypothetical protein